MSMDYQVEAGLQGQTPRNAALTPGVQIGRALLFLLLAAAVVLVPFYALQNSNNLHALQVTGRPARGTVTDKDIDTNRHGETYYLSYNYRAAGIEYTQRESVPESDYDVAEPGSLITVYFLPANPAYHHIGPVTDETIGTAMGNWELFGVLGFGFALFFVLTNESSLRRQLFLLRQGVPVQASVVNTEKKRGKNTRYYIMCNYWSGGQPISKTYQVSLALYQCTSAGSSLTVLADPNNPGNSLPYDSITGATLLGGR